MINNSIEKTDKLWYERKYNDLLEEEKTSDRKEAIKILKCLNGEVSGNE